MSTYVEPARSTHNAPTLTWDTILRWAVNLFRPLTSVKCSKHILSLLSCTYEHRLGPNRGLLTIIAELILRVMMQTKWQSCLCVLETNFPASQPCWRIRERKMSLQSAWDIYRPSDRWVSWPYTLNTLSSKTTHQPFAGAKRKNAQNCAFVRRTPMWVTDELICIAPDQMLVCMGQFGSSQVNRFVTHICLQWTLTVIGSNSTKKKKKLQKIAQLLLQCGQEKKPSCKNV